MKSTDIVLTLALGLPGQACWMVRGLAAGLGNLPCQSSTPPSEEDVSKSRARIWETIIITRSTLASKKKTISLLAFRMVTLEI